MTDFEFDPIPEGSRRERIPESWIGRKVQVEFRAIAPVETTGGLDITEYADLRDANELGVALDDGQRTRFYPWSVVRYVELATRS
ncbi:MAG: hypothetical protein M3246_02015 [Actinomycetota bacterium]|nr:hypothetical protein [Actinomycetota bacterium]